MYVEKYVGKILYLILGVEHGVRLIRRCDLYAEF